MPQSKADVNRMRFCKDEQELFVKYLTNIQALENFAPSSTFSKHDAIDDQIRLCFIELLEGCAEQRLSSSWANAYSWEVSIKLVEKIVLSGGIGLDSMGIMTPYRAPAKNFVSELIRLYEVLLKRENGAKFVCHQRKVPS